MPSKKQSSTRPDLTIVVPAYCESKRIGKTLDALARFLKTEKSLSKLAIEVIVVSADSPDDTHKIVTGKRDKFPDFKLLKPGPKVGKGRDVQYGMLHAKGNAVIFMDADLATPLRHLPKFYKAYQNGFEVVVGTRNLFKHHPGYLRRMVSNMGNLLFRVAGGVWIEDSQCGFKLFSRDASQVCFSKLHIMGWGFDMEVLAIAKANDFKMRSYRINDWVSMPDSTFTEGMLANSLKMLQELLFIFGCRLRGTYRVR